MFRYKWYRCIKVFIFGNRSFILVNDHKTSYMLAQGLSQELIQEMIALGWVEEWPLNKETL